MLASGATIIAKESPKTLPLASNKSIIGFRTTSITGSSTFIAASNIVLTGSKTF